MENVIELKKPYVFEDEEYTSIDLSGLDGLTMQDAIDAQKEVIGNGEDQVILYAPEASQAFLDEVAARASGKPVEFFNAMPIAMCSKVRTAVQEAFAVKDQAKDGVVVLDKPYSFKGETVSEIDLSGVEELTSIDVSKAENEVLKTGIYSVNMKNFFAYSCALAARASGKPMEFFTGLPLHEAVKYGERCKFFRVNASAKSLRKLAVAAASATHTGIDFFMGMPVTEFLETCKDIQEMQEQWQKATR